jgi:hypothetical protein
MKAWIVLLTVAVANGAPAENDVTESMIDEEHSRTWNRFAEQVVALHRQQLAGREVRVEERVGNYGGEMAKRYRFREASYYEAGSGRLLSRVRTDRDRPEEVQIAEVYLHDDDGRVRRDYAFVYLPWARGAPVRTFVSLHGYRNGLHAYRQFDATGNTLYEYCDGALDGRPVRIALPEERIGAVPGDAEAYRRCFAGLPEMAGAFLTPQ